MDRLPGILTSLLECAEENLSVPVCRAFIHPGPNAPWDSCEVSTDGSNGQLWVAHTLTTPEFPTPDGLPKPCGQVTWTATIEVGTTRCQQGKVQDDGGPPPPDNVTADAALQQIDRYELLQAIVCCLINQPTLRIEERDVVFDRWEPFEPTGGCVASRWIFRVRVGACGCENVTS